MVVLNVPAKRKAVDIVADIETVFLLTVLPTIKLLTS